MALAVRGGHRECVRLLREADWPSPRVAVDYIEDGPGDPPAEDSPGGGEEQPQLLVKSGGRENGRGMPPAEDGPGKGEDGGQMLLEGFGRGASSDDREERRRSGLLDEQGAENFTLTSRPAAAEEVVVVVGSGDGENERHARVAPPTCAQQQLRPNAAAETTSLRRHSFVAAGTPSARLARSSGRVLSMDMALPGLLPGRTTPSYLLELLEAPVLHTPRQRSSEPAGGEKQKQFCDKSTATSCSTVGPPSNTAPAQGFPQEEGVGAAEVPEGFHPEEWRWFSERASGVDDRNRCLGPEETFAAGDVKSRVRDVWSPVSGVAGAPLEVRLTFLMVGGVRFLLFLSCIRI